MRRERPDQLAGREGRGRKIDAVGHHDDVVQRVADALREQPRGRVGGRDSTSVRSRQRALEPAVGDPALQAGLAVEIGLGQAVQRVRADGAVRRAEPHPEPAAAVVGVDHVGAAREPVHAHRARPVAGRCAAAAPPPARRTAANRSATASSHATALTETPRRTRSRASSTACSTRPPVGDRRDERDLHASLRRGGLVREHRREAARAATAAPCLHREEVRRHDRHHQRRLDRRRDPQAVGVLGTLNLSSRPRRQSPTTRRSNAMNAEQRRHPALGQHLQVGVVHDRVVDVERVVADVVACSRSRSVPARRRAAGGRPPSPRGRPVLPCATRRSPCATLLLAARRSSISGRQSVNASSSIPATTNVPASTPPKRVRRVATAHSTTAATPTSAPRESVPNSASTSTAEHSPQHVRQRRSRNVR